MGTEHRWRPPRRRAWRWAALAVALGLIATVMGTGPAVANTTGDEPDWASFEFGHPIQHVRISATALVFDDMDGFEALPNIYIPPPATTDGSGTWEGFVQHRTVESLYATPPRGDGPHWWPLVGPEGHAMWPYAGGVSVCVEDATIRAAPDPFPLVYNEEGRLIRVGPDGEPRDDHYVVGPGLDVVVLFELTLHSGTNSPLGIQRCREGDLVDRFEIEVRAESGRGETCETAKPDVSGDGATIEVCVTNDRWDPQPDIELTTPNVGPAPLTVGFSAAPSRSGAPIVSRRWNFGDGEGQCCGATFVTHTYDQPGTYVVGLSLTDANGVERRRSDLVTVFAEDVMTVDGVGPWAELDGPERATAGVAVVFDASRSRGSPGRTGTIVSYEWDFGDGTQVTTSDLDPSWSHTYAQPGVYDVTVRVLTADAEAANAISGIAHRQIVIDAPVFNRPPQLPGLGGL